MALAPEKIKNILLISLSNIGDVILTFPVIDILLEDFPQAKLSVLAGAKGAPLFEGNKKIHEVVVYHKNQPLAENVKWFSGLRKKNFDLIVDLRNSAMPFFMSARYRTPFFLKRNPQEHMRFQHLRRLGEIHPFVEKKRPRLAFFCPEKQRRVVEELLRKEYLEPGQFVVVNPGAANASKRWTPQGFAEVCDVLTEQYRMKIVFVGDQSDVEIVSAIQKLMSHPSLNLAGKLTLPQLGVLYQSCWLALGNDSAPLHLASYLDVPVVALFGPSDPVRYGPWSSEAHFLRQNQNCVVCQTPEKARELGLEHTCLQQINAPAVLLRIAAVHSPGNKIQMTQSFQRILVVRTDRIGDVVLTTPAIKALRQNFPHAYIAALLSPATKELVIGNPDIDEVLVDDRHGVHKGIVGFWKLVHSLRRKKFDISFNFIPKKRSNLLCFWAGIPRRVAYKNDKYPFLLTDKMLDKRATGSKHETIYCLELLTAVGITAHDIPATVAVQPAAEVWADDFLKVRHWNRNQVVAVHPGASTPSRMWPAANFSQLVYALSQKYSCPFILVGAANLSPLAQEIKKAVNDSVEDLTGKTSVAQLASLLKRCRLLVSNDSGPVHMADALGTPVVSIFTRNQPGINPERWRPLGPKSRVVAVPVRTDISFSTGQVADPNYLELIRVEEVLEAVDAIYKLC